MTAIDETTAETREQDWRGVAANWTPAGSIRTVSYSTTVFHDGTT